MHTALLLVLGALASANGTSLPGGDELTLTNLQLRSRFLVSELQRLCPELFATQAVSASTYTEQDITLEIALERAYHDYLTSILRACAPDVYPTSEPVGHGDTTRPPVNPTSTTTNLPTTEPPLPLPAPCTSPDTSVLTGDYRLDNQGSDLRPDNGNYICDRDENAGVWFRFNFNISVVIRNTCSPDYSCGGQGGFWTNAQYPTVVGQRVEGRIYGNFRSDCDWYPWPVQEPLSIIKCSEDPGDFVYRVRGTGSCYWSFCAMEV